MHKSYSWYIIIFINLISFLYSFVVDVEENNSTIDIRYMHNYFYKGFHAAFFFFCSFHIMNFIYLFIY